MIKGPRRGVMIAIVGVMDHRPHVRGGPDTCAFLSALVDRSDMNGGQLRVVQRYTRLGLVPDNIMQM